MDWFLQKKGKVSTGCDWLFLATWHTVHVAAFQRLNFVYLALKNFGNACVLQGCHSCFWAHFVYVCIEKSGFGVRATKWSHYKVDCRLAVISHSSTNLHTKVCMISNKKVPHELHYMSYALNIKLRRLRTFYLQFVWHFFPSCSLPFYHDFERNYTNFIKSDFAPSFKGLM